MATEIAPHLLMKVQRCWSLCNEETLGVVAETGSKQQKGSKARREKTTAGATERAATASKVTGKGEPKASAGQARGAGRKRPNKRIPSNVDDLDKALSKRAKQLFSGISM